jgi:OTU domain-containing protein 3
VQTKTLTRRQRKALGLPKPRSVLVAKQSAGAGKIVIPGGKYSGKKTRGRVGVRGAGDDDDNDEGVEVEVGWRRKRMVELSGG